MPDVSPAGHPIAGCASAAAESAIREAACRLRLGQPVIFPTDTVYGLGVSVAHCPSPQALFELKGRAAEKPVAWLVSGIGDLDRYGADVPDAARALVAEGWPGALTVIVKASDAVPEAYRSQAGTIGLRMPDSQAALALMQAVGGPLATTSANVSGCPPARCYEEIDAALLTKAFVLADDSQVQSGVASTVVDCTTSTPQILR